jgi:hypothetical protein
MLNEFTFGLTQKGMSLPLTLEKSTSLLMCLESSTFGYLPIHLSNPLWKIVSIKITLSCNFQSMTYNMLKTQLFLHATLDYNQVYNFILNHNYKFKTIILFKDVWVSKSKGIYVFLFFKCFECMDFFLWNILNFTKKLTINMNK